MTPDGIVLFFAWCLFPSPVWSFRLISKENSRPLFPTSREFMREFGGIYFVFGLFIVSPVDGLIPNSIVVLSRLACVWTAREMKTGISSPVTPAACLAASSVSGGMLGVCVDPDRLRIALYPA